MIWLCLLLFLNGAGMLQDEVQLETIVPVPSAENRAAAAGWHAGREWRAQHDDCVKIAQESNDLILLGDSITQSFGGPGRRTGQPACEVLNRIFSGIRIGNMGISGDRTQHLLWRLQNGALEGPTPRAYVLAIGTNNIGHDDPEAIAAGIEQIVKHLLEVRSGTPILLCPILPRGFKADDPERLSVQAVNKRIRILAGEDQVSWIECEADFIDKDGGLRCELFAADGLHLAIPGYEVWGRAIKLSYLDATADESD